MFSVTFNLILEAPIMCRYASLFLAAVLTLAIVTTAARAEEIKNEYFSLNIPTGWVTSAGPSQNGAVTVLVQNTKDIVALSISVTPAPMPARELVEQTVKNMRFGGTRVEQPVQQGDSFVIGFEQRRREVKGMSYFTSHGDKGSIITIMAPMDTEGLTRGKAFLQENLKPEDARLFPDKF